MAWDLINHNEKNMSRLFSFGCSYTQAPYPTWADLLSNHFNSYENWAITGLGNRGIFHRLNEAILKRSINKNDTVVLMWSSPTREDRWFEDRGWVALGNIYNQNFYNNEWTQKYFDPFMSLMETLNYAHAAQRMLDNIGCKWAMAWMVELLPDNLDINWGENPPGDVPLSQLCDPGNKLTKFFRNIGRHPNMVSGEMESYKNSIMKKYNIPELVTNGTIDGHPNSLAGYYYLQEKIIPCLKIENFDKDKKIFQLAQQWALYTSKKTWDINKPKFSFNAASYADVHPKDSF